MTQIGHGAKLELGDGGGPETFTEILGVDDITGGSNKVDALDSTTLSTSGNKRTFVGGLENSGDVTIKMFDLPGDTTQNALRAAKDGQLHNFKWILPGGAETRAFAGLVLSIDPSTPNDKLMMKTCKIQISGSVTYS